MNAILCENISDENFLWWIDESLYWIKKGIEIKESLFERKSLENTPFYDKIVKIILENSSEEFLMKAIDEFAEADKIKVKEILNLK